MKRFEPYIGDINGLTQISPGEKKPYVHPALKNLGAVSIVVIREVVAPFVARNLEAEITDIEIGEEVYIRAVPNKFKFSERGRGLQILRAYGVGGRLPQNKTILFKDQKPSDAFDLNTLVFGDSTTHDGRVLPIKASVSYSDALSLMPKALCVGDTFHNRAAEDGTLFDADGKKNSDNLFTRHFVLPGTLMIQVLSTRGKVLPMVGLEHLMLCMGFAGSYGGQTSLTGTNIRTHLVGVYGGRFEKALSSPYELVKKLDLIDNEAVRKEPALAIAHLHPLLAEAHEHALPPAEAQAWAADLIARFERDDVELRRAYEQAAPKVATLFDEWFGK